MQKEQLFKAEPDVFLKLAYADDTEQTKGVALALSVYDVAQSGEQLQSGNLRSDELKLIHQISTSTRRLKKNKG